jgi:hypothetical protein
MIRFILGGLLVAAVAAGSLLGGTSASAATIIPAAAAGHVLADASTVKPPKIKQVRYVCHPDGAIVSLKLRNPNKMELSFLIALSGGDVQEAQALTLSGRTAERARFDGIVNGEYRLQVFDLLGETLASAEVLVECPPVTQATRA